MNILNEEAVRKLQSGNSVWVCGLAGCSKTYNADRIKSALGLKQVIEDTGFTKDVPVNGTLILSNWPVNIEGIYCITFYEAMSVVEYLGY